MVIKLVKRILPIIALASGLVVAPALAQTNFEATLNHSISFGYILRTNSPPFGFAELSFNAATSNLVVTSGSYGNFLVGPTSVTIDFTMPPKPGFPITIGYPLFSLTLDSPAATNGTFSGSVLLNTAQIGELYAGELTVEVRSLGGHPFTSTSQEIYGQLRPVPEPAIIALLGLGGLVLLGKRKKSVSSFKTYRIMQD